MTLEAAIDELAASGRLVSLNLTKTDRGFQCSILTDTRGWSICVKPTASEALLAVVGSRTGYTQELTDEFTEAQWADRDTAEARTYWHHGESGCVYIVERGEKLPTDGLSEEIDEGQYEILKAEYERAADDFSHLI